MMERTQRILTLAHALDDALLRSAKECMRRTHKTTDEQVRDLLFAEAGEMRRLSEFAGAIVRLGEEELEEQRPRSRRELAAAQPKKRRPWLRIVGAGA